MSEIGANIRHQAELGIVPPAFNFAPVREDGLRVLAGAPFAEGPDSAVFADFKAKVGRLDIPQDREGPPDRVRARGADRPVPPRLRADACDARRDRAARDREQRRLEPARRRRLLCPSPPRQSTTTDMSAEQIHQTGLDQVAPDPWRDGADQGAGRLHRHAPAILRPHQCGRGVQISEHRRRAGRPISPTPAPSSPR